MTEISSLLSGFGLAASAGLNAYIPLLTIALAARLRPDLVQLAEPYDLITSAWAIGTLFFLLAVEVLADKVPVVDHLNDFLGLIVRPTAGAVLFAASTGTVAFLDPKLALALGFVVAGAAHGAKATARPVVTTTTGGLGNPVVSTLEDVASALTSVVALVAPLLIGVAGLLFAALFVWWIARRPRRPGSSPAAV
jgi:hypothetical protein